MKRISIALSVTTAILIGNVTIAQEETGVPEEIVKELSYLVGSWKVEGKRGDDEFGGTATYKWAPNKEKHKYCLVTNWLVGPDGNIPPGISIMGWNSANRCIVESGFDAQGNFYETHWVVKSRTQWKGEFSNVRDGEKVEGRGVVVKKGPTEFVYEAETTTGETGRTVFTKVTKERETGKQEKPKSIASPLASGQELTEEQKGPWSALEEQVGLDIKQDWKGTEKFMHPKGCFWGDMLPAPVSMKSEPYYEKLREGEDEAVAHHLIPVSVVVVDDVAIINFYLLLLTRTEDDNGNGKQVEKVYRGHNTWKKEKGRWLLLSTYNTMVETKDDD
jgi:hypothetical protein